MTSSASASLICASRIGEGVVILIERVQGLLEVGKEPPGESPLTVGDDLRVAVEGAHQPGGAGFGASGDEQLLISLHELD